MTANPTGVPVGNAVIVDVDVVVPVLEEVDEDEPVLVDVVVAVIDSVGVDVAVEVRVGVADDVSLLVCV